MIESVSSHTKEDQQDVDKIEEDLKHFKHRNRTLTNVVERMATEIDELRGRLENVELNNAKKGISLSGLEIATKKKDAIRQIEIFFEDALDIRLRIEDFFHLGEKNNNVIVVFFQSMRQKQEVLQAKSLLKDFRNSNGRKVYINDYTPAVNQERMYRQNQILKSNSEADKPVEIDFRKGKMCICRGPEMEGGPNFI